VAGLLRAVVLAAALLPATVPDPAVATSARDTGAVIETGRRNAIVRAAEQVSPAVATVSVLRRELVVQRVYPEGYEDFFGPFFPGIRRRVWKPVQGMGSGVVVSKSGIVLTNHHVVKGAGEIRVTLSDGREYSAVVVGGEERYDLAVLRFDPAGEDIPVATGGSSADLMIGEWVIALGNPFGYVLGDSRPTVTVGVVSALNRDLLPSGSSTVTMYRGMIQTDAAINPGNSGGALANALGEVVGINTFILSKSGGSQGIGFAIPMDTAMRVLREIVDYGAVREVWIGCRINDIPAALAERLSLESTEGVIVADVEQGSPAERAGMRRGDVITEIQGETIRRFEDATYALYGFLVGDDITFEVQRGDRVVTRTLHLAERR
jgi:serine protease Do